MIQFNSLITDFAVTRQIILKKWLEEVIRSENKKPGDLTFIFCTDEYLLEINRNFLRHDYFTDIITFPTSAQSAIISGEIYLSIDRIRENASNAKTKFNDEFARVLVHGVLHLIGYNDHNTDEMTTMRSKEDNYLLLLPDF